MLPLSSSRDTSMGVSLVMMALF
jgi:hypothetical protein